MGTTIPVFGRTTEFSLSGAARNSCGIGDRALFKLFGQPRAAKLRVA
ncbi:MAG: hypothetical protein LBR47_01465 [Spirochaetaceae bacterium]|jgi:hypothetical protein|nr:hypothetical protein [Spirochaetaceae bacterium]